MPSTVPTSTRHSSVENSNEKSQPAQRRPLLQAQSMDSSSLSSPAVSHTLHLPLLVLTAHRSDVYELTTVLSDRQSVTPAQFAFELVHFPLLASEAEENLSFSDLSGLLKLIATGHFAALFVFPPCSTWSRARHSGSPGPKPLRSRQHPLGLPSLPPEHQHVLASHNQALEFAVMCAEIAQQFCPAVSIIWVAPEDLGGHVQTGPPSVWQIRETTQLQSRTSDVVRGVAYSCELGAAEYTRPVGFLTNVPGLIRELRRGWPVFQHRGPVLRYRGPLPQSCACGSKHTSLEGVATSKALPLFSQRFGSSCCCKCLQGIGPLGMGFSPAPCQGIFGRSTAFRAIPGSHRLRQRQTASESSSRSSCQQWVRSALLPLRHVGRLLCLECTMGLEFLYLRGQGLERLYHLRLRSPRPLIPLSLPLQLTPRVLPLFGEQLTAAMRSLLSVLVEGAWVPMDGTSVGRFRASLVPAVLVEKTRQSHRMKSEEVRNVVRQRCCAAVKASRSGGQQMIFRSRIEVARDGALRGRGGASVKVRSIRRGVPTLCITSTRS